MLPLLQVADLLAKTDQNKELNNKKRLATSGANFHNSRQEMIAFCNQFWACRLCAVLLVGHAVVCKGRLQLLLACRTIADGTCTFPNNLFGCGNRNVAGNVKFIADDLDLECQVSPFAMAA